jgi:hypothetical protein
MGKKGKKLERSTKRRSTDLGEGGMWSRYFWGHILGGEQMNVVEVVKVSIPGIGVSAISTDGRLLRCPSRPQFAVG